MYVIYSDCTWVKTEYSNDGFRRTQFSNKPIYIYCILYIIVLHYIPVNWLAPRVLISPIKIGHPVFHLLHHLLYIYPPN